MITVGFSPQQAIKNEIILRAINHNVYEVYDITIDNIDEVFNDFCECDSNDWYDYKEDFRCGGISTNLPCGYSRCYESDAVACKLSSGAWIGWTYYHGGGKHGEPQRMDWMEDAYWVDCIEEEKLTIVRTFSKP